MWFAYADESGDAGPWLPGGKGGSRTYTLGCTMLEAERWPAVFDEMIDFRRFLHRTFRVPVRREIKATHLVRGRDVFQELKTADVERRAIFRLHMTVQAKLGLLTFAVVIRKDVPNPFPDPREVAWETLLQRLERHMYYANTSLMLIHDEGENAVVRKLARKARRAGTAGSAFGTGMLRRPATRLLDDPVPRDSSQSYFVQLADLSAYAAYRHVYPVANPNKYTVVPQNTWLKIGDALHRPVNRLGGGPPGLVVRA